MQVSFSGRWTILLIGSVVAPCVLLLALGLWSIRQERELAEKRADDDRARVATLAGQQLLARLEAVTLRAVAGGVTPADREIALFGLHDPGNLWLPWQLTDRSNAADPELTDVQQMLLADQARGIARLWQISKQAATPGARARATLMLMAALRKSGKGEDSAAERDLRALPVQVVDEYGIPYFLYAAWRAPADSAATGGLLRDLENALTGAWLPPAAIFMIADVARHAGAPGASLEQRAQAQAKERERSIRVLSEIPVNAPSRWILSTDADPPLLTSVAEGGGGERKTLVVLRPRPVLDAIQLSAHAQWVISSGNGSPPASLTATDTIPQLKIRFSTVPSNETSSSRQVLYLVSLGLVVLMTALSAALLHRDMRREAGLAHLRSAFVSSVSHELRTPIATIRACSEMLDMGRIAEDQRPAYLKTIIGESERLSRLVEGVLQFSRGEQRTRPLHFEPVQLNDVIRSAAQGIKFTLEQNGFQLRIAAEADPCVAADRHALEQVFINLLTNAIKYSGARREIDLGVRQDGNHAIVCIRDYGVGIAQQHQKRIFERFYRVDTPEGRNVPGVGLGLAIVQQIVTAHGGRIAVESVLEEGSAFSVILPLSA